MAHQFCRDVCLERGEPMPGTGSFAQRVILVAWPRGKWRLPRFESVDMPPVLSLAIQQAMKAGVHVALVDRVGETDQIAQVQADGIVANYPGPEALAGAIERFVAGEPLAGIRDDRPVVLTCTDSRRDACCARYGFSTYKALKDAIDPVAINLLQCTHIGGCRFAASLVVLPQRHRYGRLSPEQVPGFVAALTAGEIYLPAFRGRADIPETAQVAEHASMSWAQAHGLPWQDIGLAATHWPDEGDDGAEFACEARAGSARLRIALRAQMGPMQGACTSLSEPPEMKVRWHVTSVSQIA